jgi:hypothetical protein
VATTVTITQQVRDYDLWRPAFDGHAPVRRQHGFTNEVVYRGADDSNSILVAMDAPSRDAVLGFAADPSLKAVMDAAGVISEPVVVIGETLSAQPV